MHANSYAAKIAGMPQSHARRQRVDGPRTAVIIHCTVRGHAWDPGHKHTRPKENMEKNTQGLTCERKQSEHAHREAADVHGVRVLEQGGFFVQFLARA